MVQLPQAIRNNATAILAEGHKYVFGEVLLWLLARQGGQLTMAQIIQVITATLDGQNRAREQQGFGPVFIPIPNTYFTRKIAALSARAKRSGVSADAAVNAFHLQEDYETGVQSGTIATVNTNVPASNTASSTAPLPNFPPPNFPPYNPAEDAATRQAVLARYYADFYASYEFTDEQEAELFPASLLDPLEEEHGPFEPYFYDPHET